MSVNCEIRTALGREVFVPAKYPVLYGDNEMNGNIVRMRVTR